MMLATMVMAAALDPATTADVRCLAVFSSMVGSGQPRAVEAGKLGASYFVGKLNGRDPTLDIGAALRREAATMNPKTEVQRCAGELQRLGQTMMSLGSPPPKKP